MSTFVSLWLAACVGFVAYGLARLPSWLFTSINRGSLWTWRDLVFDWRTDGTLPDAPETERVLSMIEDHILTFEQYTPMRSMRVQWVLRRRGTNANDDDGFVHPSDWTLRERETLMLCQSALALLVVRQYFTGSWSGLLASIRHPVASWVLVFAFKHSVVEFTRFVMAEDDHAMNKPVERNLELVSRIEVMTTHVKPRGREQRNRGLVRAAG